MAMQFMTLMEKAEEALEEANRSHDEEIRANHLREAQVYATLATARQLRNNKS